MSEEFKTAIDAHYQKELWQQLDNLCMAGIELSRQREARDARMPHSIAKALDAYNDCVIEFNAILKAVIGEMIPEMTAEFQASEIGKRYAEWDHDLWNAMIETIQPGDARRSRELRIVGDNCEAPDLRMTLDRST